MNPKIKKLQAERAKNCDKISKLAARNDEIDQEITKLENLDIIGLVRGVGLTPEQLAAILQNAAHTAPEPEIGQPAAEVQDGEGQDYGEGQSYAED